MNNLFTKELQQTLKRSTKEAVQRQHEFVTLEHLLYALTFDKTSCEIFLYIGIDVSSLGKRIKKFLDNELIFIKLEKPSKPHYTIGLQYIIQLALTHAESSESGEQVDGANLLAAIFEEEDSHAVYFLKEEGISRLDIVSYLANKTHEDIINAKSKNNDITTSGTILANPLTRFCVNLNERVSKLKNDPLIGRQDEMDRLIHIIARRSKNNPILVGDAGVGKTTIVEELANKILKGTIPIELQNFKIYSLDMATLLSGTRYRGEFEERLKSIINAIKKEKNVLLFIDEIHTIIGAGTTSGGSLDASNIFKPALTNGEISCIGTTTYKEYRNIFEKDQAIARRFQKVEVKEPSTKDTIAILHGLQKKYEDYHKVKYTNSAIKAAVTLSSRHIHDRHLPDKAIDIMDEVGAKIKLQQRKNKKKQVNPKVYARDVEDLLSKLVKIPSQRIKFNDKKILQNLEHNLKQIVFGQEEAIHQISNTIQLSRSGLGESNKTTGSFLFAGPTGVGKTELSKQIANQLGIKFLRFDMSEYMEKHAISRLIGSPPGYVGFDQGGQLTEAIYRNPYCVLLLDEIEKAHEDLFNILLQVMDYATLTDNNGRKSDFQNIILIMTTNTGARESLQNTIGFGPTMNVNKNIKAIEKTFSPEFRNRLSSIIQFNSLSPENITNIVKENILKLSQRLKVKNVSIQFSESALLYLSKKGFDIHYGARPIQRLIEQEITQILSKEILFGKLSSGGTVKIKTKNNSLKFDY